MERTTKDSVDESTLYHDEPVTSLKEALLNGKLLKLTMYGMFIAFAFRLPAIVMPILGAKYFKSDDDENTTGCNSKGNATYAMYFSLVSCIGGAFGFLFESYLGRISDAYGRKTIMYFTWFVLFIGNASMCLTNNVWFYLILFPLSSFAGLFSGMPTVLASALSDCVIPKYKTTIFAILFGLAGIVSILGSVIAALLTSFISIKAPFFAFAITMFIALLWLIFFVDETLSVEHRVPMTRNTDNSSCSYNPLSALYDIGDNKVILWVSLMALITAIPESGIDDMITSYTDDILSLCDDDKKAANFNAISGISMGLTMLISQLIVLPILTKFFNDIFLFVFVLFAVFAFMCSGIMAYIFPSYITGILIWSCFGLSFITSPITNGCLAKRLNKKQQGIGMGILHSMKGLTFTIAPYTFGGLYDLFANKGILKTIPFMLGILFVFIGIIILFGPLKKTLNQYDDNILRKGLVPISETHIVQKQ